MWARSLVTLFVLGAHLSHAQQPHTPEAKPEAIVTVGEARFTVLTDRLIRMEWDDDRTFEDRASLVFIDRNLDVPDYQVNRDGNQITINTGPLQLRYQPEAGRFDSTNLEVQFQVARKSRTWHPGIENEGNLKGTTRTLDGVNGATKLRNGILLREGWALVEDTNRPLFDDSDMTARWHYDGFSLTTFIQLPDSSVYDTITVEVTFPGLIDDPRFSGMRGYTNRLQRSMKVFSSLWKDDWTPEEMIDLYQTGRRVELAPETAG